MKNTSFIRRDVVIYLAAAAATAILAGLLGWGLADVEAPGFLSFTRRFFWLSWYVQLPNTCLFLAGVLFWIRRYDELKDEERVIDRLVVPEFSIRRHKADALIQELPSQYAGTLGFRRVRELLQAFSAGEDVIRLGEELSRRDMEQIDQGHLTMNTLRSLMPLLGFLGTVLGLSMGIARFPEMTSASVLRAALRDFAASLSVAFDTTLLGLIFTVVITLMLAYLRTREEGLVTRVDEQARALISKIRFEARLAETPGGDRSLLTERLVHQNQQLVREIGGHLSNCLDAISTKLEELKVELRQPPQYQIVVRPLEGGGDAHRER